METVSSVSGHYIEKNKMEFLEDDFVLVDPDSRDNIPGEIQHENQGTTIYKIGLLV